MSRREARESAMKILYSKEIDRSSKLAEARALFLENYPLNQDDLSFFDQLIEGVLEQHESLDQVIEKRLSGWSIDRLPKVDLTILRIALYEIVFTKYVPNNVAIAEAVRLAKRFSDDTARVYINAVLGGIDRDLQELFKDNTEFGAREVLVKLEQKDAE